MAIIKNKPAAKAPSNPAFEAVNEEEKTSTPATNSVETKTESVPDTKTVPAHDPIATAAANHQVAVQHKSSAVAVAGAQVVSPFVALQSAYRVNYDTLMALQATNGNILEKTSGKELGKVICLELMSYQKNFVVSTGVDSDEARGLVRYSDDGVTLKDGTPVDQYLKELKDADYDDAKISERCVIVGALTDPGAAPELQDTLVQIDLPPSCKTLFDRYQIQASYDLKKNRCTLEEAIQIKITCRVEKKLIGAKTVIWTVTDFTRAPKVAA